MAVDKPGVLAKVAGILAKFGISIASVTQKERLKSQILQFENLFNGLKSRLKNRDFLKRAPKEIVEKEKLKEQELSEKISKLQLAVKQLS